MEILLPPENGKTPTSKVSKRYQTVIALKQNHVANSVVSQYGYTVNSIGQRSHVAQSGTAFAAVRGIAWGYDALGQVTSADHDADNSFDRAYQYETIGSNSKVIIYDGWNPIAEYKLQNSSFTHQTSLLWGLDLSGTLQGAGGVGGLLCETQASGVYYATYDGNGNVSEYLDSTGNLAAHFEYDSFGNTIVNTDAAGFFQYRFSTKPLDPTTGLYYYGYRWYDPLTGRWPSRDPIGEEVFFSFYAKGLEKEAMSKLREKTFGNQCAFVNNNVVNIIDILGLTSCKSQIYSTLHNGTHVTCDDGSVDFWFHFGPDITKMTPPDGAFPLWSPGLWYKEKPGFVGVPIISVCLSKQEAGMVENWVDARVYVQPDIYSAAFFNCWTASSLAMRQVLGETEYSKRSKFLR